MKRLWSILVPYRSLVFFVLFISLIQSAADLAVPQLVRFMMDVVLPGGNLRLLTVYCMIGLGFFAVKALINYMHTVYIFDISHRVSKQMRVRLFRHIGNLPLGYFITRPKGTIVSKVISDVNAAERLVLTLFSRIAGQAVELLAILAVVLYFNALLGVVLVLIVPTLGFVLYVNARQIRRLSRLIQRQIGQLNARVTEAIDAIVVTRIYGRQDYEVDRFADMTESYRMMNMNRRQSVGRMESSVDLFGNAGLVFIFWVGGYLLFQDRLTIGELTANVLYLQMMLRPLRSIVTMHTIFQEGMASLERIEELLNTPAEEDQGSSDSELPLEFDEVVSAVKEPAAARVELDRERITGSVAFSDVSFSYPNGEQVLHDINFEVQSGETVALVGPSGAGKSSIVQLIPRLYVPTSGRILLDGVDTATMELKFLRSLIAFVTQEPILFAGTIYDNIAYGRPGATEEQVIEAAVAANAHEFISRLPNGYQTEIGERGVKLSGGQKQRLSIARAIIKDPKILILDEATSFQDAESERAIQDALRYLLHGKTSFIIAHRLSTIVEADRIFVVQYGRIVQQGTHRQLMNEPGLYKKLYRMQFEQAEQLLYRERG